MKVEYCPIHKEFCPAIVKAWLLQFSGKTLTTRPGVVLLEANKGTKAIKTQDGFCNGELFGL